MNKYKASLNAILKTDIESLSKNIERLEEDYNRLIILDNADNETIFGLKKHIEKQIKAINDNNFYRSRAIDNRKDAHEEQTKFVTITAEHLATLLCIFPTVFGVRGVMDLALSDKPFVPLAISVPLLLSWPISMAVIKTVKNRDIIAHKIKTKFEQPKIEKLNNQLNDIERVLHHKELGGKVTDILHSEITALKQEKDRKEKMLKNQKAVFKELENTY